MSSKKKEPIRPFGQRSIASAFVFRSSCLAKDSKDGAKLKDSRMNSRVSLSDFLEQKLGRTSEPPRRVPGKLTPFSTILDPKASSDSPVNEVGVKRGGQKEADTGLGKVIFEQFKQSNTEKVNPVETCSTNESKEFNSDEMENLKKRRNPFECGEDPHPPVRKHVIVLADDSTKGPGHKQTKGSFMRNKRPRSPYNHYACKGWWDDDMEGVDDEELGCNEVWEGVGSTTLGRIIDWH